MTGRLQLLLGNGTLEIEGPSPKGRRREGSGFWVDPFPGLGIGVQGLGLRHRGTVGWEVLRISGVSELFGSLLSSCVLHGCRMVGLGFRGFGRAAAPKNCSLGRILWVGFRSTGLFQS